MIRLRHASRVRNAALALWIACAAALLVVSPLRAQDNPIVDDRALAPPQTEDASFGGVFFMSYHTDVTGERRIEIVGTAITWLLLSLSMVNFALIVRLVLANQRKSILPDGVVSEARRLIGGGDYRQVLELTRRDESFFSRLLHSSLSEASHGTAAMQRTMENEADLMITARMRPIEILYMFGQVSPMMGLLGTVYGIIHAFLAFVSTGGHASPTVLAGGIGTALVATFWGLIVAIPALSAYALLRNKVDVLTLEATNAVEDIISQFRPRAASAAPSTPKPAPAVAAARDGG